MLGAVSLPLYVYLRVGFPQLWIVTEDVGVVLDYIYLHFDLIFLQASLISAVFISCERFFAVYWPLRHLTTSTGAYTIVIIIIWTLAATATAVYLLTGNLISNKVGFMFLQYYFQSLSSSYVAVRLVFGENFTRETVLFYNTIESHKTNA